MHALDGGREYAPPGYIVFPALVLGVGQHGESVVHRLHRRLRDEDPNLLAVVRLCILVRTAAGAQLIELNTTSGVPVSTRYPTETSLLDLLNPRGALAADLRQMCDTLAVHEQMQTLHEHGYVTFEEHHDIRVRAYMVADLEEHMAREALPALAGAVQELLRRRGDLYCTAICLESDDPDSRSAASELGAGPIDALYLTNHIKHHGFLARNRGEIEVAHSLFLESMLLSELERTVHGSEALPGIGTFGVAAVRLGIDEMASWLRSQLALTVITRSYLAAGDESSVDAQNNVDFWRRMWDATLHNLSTPEAAIRIHDDVPEVTLPTDSALRLWCSAIMQQRLLTPRSDLVDVLDRELAAIPCPLPEILSACTLHLHRGADEMRRQMHDQLGITCFGDTSGSMARAAQTLDAWTRAMQRTADGATRGKPTGAVSTETSEFLIWLHESLDDMALRVRRRRGTQATAPALLARVAIAALLVGVLPRAIHLSSAAVSARLVAIVFLMGIAWAGINEFRRRSFERRVFAGFIDRLERRLSVWLHTRTQETLAGLINWTGEAEIASEVLSAEFHRLRDRYLSLSAAVPVATDTCFLEQVHVDTERCRRLLNEVDEVALLQEQDIRRLPLDFLLPLGEGSLHAVPAIIDDAEVEHQLLEAIDAFAHPQMRSLRQHSLHDLIIDSARDAEESIAEQYAATLQTLHERALPLRQFGHSSMAGTSEQRLVAGGRMLHAVSSGTPDGPSEITACLVPFGSEEWRSAVDKRAAGPSHVHLVDHADQETVLYVRTVFGLSPTAGT